MKGRLPFESVVLGKIENKTFYLDFDEKFYNMIFEIFPVYSNVKIVQEKNEKDSLNITIKDYSRTIYGYGDDGNIKSYRYLLNVEYKISNLTENVLTEKIFEPTLSENECKDSLVVINLKSFIDRIRKEF